MKKSTIQKDIGLLVEKSFALKPVKSTDQHRKQLSNFEATKRRYALAVKEDVERTKDFVSNTLNHLSLSTTTENSTDCLLFTKDVFKKWKNPENSTNYLLFMKDAFKKWKNPE